MRLSIRKIKEVLRLRFELGLRQASDRAELRDQVDHSPRVSGTSCGGRIGWPLPEGLGEEELEAKLFGNQPVTAQAARPQPAWKAIHEQLHNKFAQVPLLPELLADYGVEQFELGNHMTGSTSKWRAISLVCQREP